MADKLSTLVEELAPDTLVHWTDRPGLFAIFRERFFLESTSFSETLHLPFDVDNDLKFGLLVKRDAVMQFGGHRYGEDELGHTPLEMKYEIVADQPVPIRAIRGGITRTPIARGMLEQHFIHLGRRYHIAMAVMPKFQTLDRPDD